MSISGRALKRLEQSFSDLCLCKNMLVVRPTEHIVRGFVFDRTPYKGLFYFLGVVRPLYSTAPIGVLGYGERLAKGEYIDLGERNFDASVRQLAEIISRSELDDLQGIRRPEDFLAKFGGPSSSEGFASWISAYDAALTYYLIGKPSLCVEILEDFASEDMTWGSVDLRVQARNLAREMRRDFSAAERHIEALEQGNIERFRLAPTMSISRDRPPEPRSRGKTTANPEGRRNRSTKKLQARALRFLQHAFPELSACYDLLVVPPAQHLLRCLLFEGHLETGCVYVWRVVMPLYRPVRTIILNYGSRLLDGELIDLTDFDMERIVRAISERELSDLQNCRTPKDFLRRVDWKSLPQTPNYRLDLALTHYLVGHASTCLEILEAVLAQKWRPVWDDTTNLAREILQELKTDRAAMDRRLEAWRTRSIEIYGLAGRSRRGASSHADKKQTTP